ncbi:MAG: allantoinase AllB [Planctomycetota bacterium]
MVKSRWVLRGRRVVTPSGERAASLVIEAGVIQEVLPGEAIGSQADVDCGDHIVAPGLIDTHVHVNEPGRTEWEGFVTAGRAAAAGGVTTLVDMPLNSSPVTTTVEALAAKRRAAQACLVDFGFWGGVVPGNLAELRPLAEAGVLGFKCFLIDSGIPEFAAVGEADLRAAMAELASLNTVLLVHAELPGPVAEAVPPPGADLRRYSTYLGSRPRSAEHDAIELVISLVAQTGARAHIVHVSSAGSLARLARARAAGLPITAETCPHYLTLCAESIPDGATEFKCAPPIREAENRERLWAGLAAGTIDLVASDHSPCPPALKLRESGDFARAWGGVAGLELTLPLLWTGARARGYAPVDLARWLSTGPAHLAGLAGRKGRIEPGYDADFVVWDPDREWQVEQQNLVQRHKLTPYHGLVVVGAVLQTFVRGELVFDRGRFSERASGGWMRGRTS